MKKRYIAPANVLYELCLKDSVLTNMSIYTGEGGSDVTDDTEWDTQKKHNYWDSDREEFPW